MRDVDYDCGEVMKLAFQKQIRFVFFVNVKTPSTLTTLQYVCDALYCSHTYIYTVPTLPPPFHQCVLYVCIVSNFIMVYHGT